MITSMATRTLDQGKPVLGQAPAMRLRFEILPFGKGVEQASRVEQPLHLTVTTSPKHGVDRTVDVAVDLRRGGHAVTPHIAARMVRSDDHLTEILERTRGAGIDDLFVIGGDAEEPLGPYTAAGELLDVLAAHPLRPSAIGIGAYPEGHPLIDPAALESALEQKSRIASYVVTQLCFDVKALVAWLEGVRARGIELPVLLGAVGPVERRRLLEIATRIGVGPSLRFVRKQRGLTQLFRSPVHSATRFYDEAAPLVGDPALGIAGFHFFTFNDLTGTVRWQDERRIRARAAHRAPDDQIIAREEP
jgi:methylenetetrahydrofolate reductase (NADH)